MNEFAPPRQLRRYARETLVEIIEAYKDWQPPIDGRKAVTAAIGAVPKDYLVGIGRVILTNTGGLNREQRRKKTKHQGKTRHSKEALGNYGRPWQGQTAYINLFVDNIVSQCPRAIKLPPIRDVFFADIIFHEIGHHIHTTQIKPFRDRQCVADEWARRLGELYLRKRGWYLLPLLRWLGLYTSLRIMPPRA